MAPRKSSRKKAKGRDYAEMQNGCKKVAKDGKNIDSNEEHFEISEETAVQQDILETLEHEEKELEIQLRRARIHKKREELQQITEKPTVLPTQFDTSTPQSQIKSSTAESTETLNLKTLAGDQELNRVMELLQTSHLRDILGLGGSELAQSIGQSATGKCNVKFVSDYVVLPRSSCRNREQQVGHRLFLKEKSKIKTESITEAQWAGASVRILHDMLDVMDKEEIAAYLTYMGEMSDFLQICETSSVMLLDEEHRIMVNSKGRKWDDIEKNKSFFYLKKLEDTDGDQRAPRAYKKPYQPNQGEKKRPVCFDFNKEAGCERSYCTYLHACIICKSPSHPKYMHNANGNVPPRFRDSAQS